MTSRRLFLGSVAAAGVGTVGVTTLDFSVPVAAQRPKVDNDPVVLELQRQMRAVMAKMRNGDAEGARGAAALLSIWAARLESNGADRTLRDLARKYGRNPGTANHLEMDRQAKAMGSDLFGLSVHVNPDSKKADRAYAALRGRGLAAQMREAAAALEATAAKWPKDGFLVTRVQLGDNGNPYNYRDCPVCAAADGAYEGANYACQVAAVVALVPGAGQLAMEACGAAMAFWLSLEAACQASRLFGC